MFRRTRGVSRNDKNQELHHTPIPGAKHRLRVRATLSLVTLFFLLRGGGSGQIIATLGAAATRLFISIIMGGK
jgi:hypothetical protein